MSDAALFFSDFNLLGRTAYSRKIVVCTKQSVLLVSNMQAQRVPKWAEHFIVFRVFQLPLGRRDRSPDHQITSNKICLRRDHFHKKQEPGCLKVGTYLFERRTTCSFLGQFQFIWIFVASDLSVLWVWLANRIKSFDRQWNRSIVSDQTCKITDSGIVCPDRWNSIIIKIQSCDSESSRLWKLPNFPH